MVLRVTALMTLIVGIVFWVTDNDSLVNYHMPLGIIVVLSLWVLAITAALGKGGNWGLAIGAIVLGLVVASLGMVQKNLLVGSTHWIIQVIHLLLGLSAIALGEMIARRYKRLNKAIA